MAQLMEYAGYLAKEIGPRPAGTEEEQQAALYITEQFQKDTGFAANIEEFSTSTDYDTSRLILCLVAIIVTILAMIFPILAIPAFILAAAAAVVYTLEALDRPIIAGVLGRSASQNIVAKYQPNFDDAANGATGKAPRSRKVVLIAHYDTGRVTPPLVERVRSTSLPIALICVIGIIALAFFGLLRIFMAQSGGMGLLVINILSIIAIIVCLLPVAKSILMRRAPYNEGANNNATGTAALLEIARRIARGSVSEADLAQSAPEDIRIHGEAAAREAGLVPEGAQIRYEAEQITPPSDLGEYDEEERLLAAKAAIAALTGKPVERRVYGSVADKLVNSYADENAPDYIEPSDRSDASQPTPMPAPEPAQEEQAEGFQNAPSWFIAAQKNAKRQQNDEAPSQVQRSKYTEAMEYAERERTEREEEQRAAEEAERQAALRAAEQEARDALEGTRGSSQSAADEAELAGPADVEVPASPSSTIAMAAPVSAAEIAAEYAASEAAEAEAQAVEVRLIDEPNGGKRFDDDVELQTHAPMTRERITSLPTIEPSEPASVMQTPAPTSSPSRSGILRKLRTNVPSLSGIINPVTVDEQAEQPQRRKPQPRHQRVASDAVPQVVNVPTPVDAPSSENSVDYDMEVPYTEAELAAVPRTRSGSLLGRLRNEQEETLVDTPQEWLDVDDDFEARKVGQDRGSWESFRDDQYFDDDDSFDEFGTGDEEKPRRHWNGGAYSRTSLGRVNMRSGEDSEADQVIPDEPPEIEADRSLTGEIEQIYHFRNPQFNTEVWFVAIGADGEGHDGARAFLEEHGDDLRGSMIIEIESLGAGALSVAKEEGRLRKIAASSRVKRYTRSAVSATGIAIDEVSLAGSDSIASTAQKAGYQTMHLFGAEDGRPALKGSADDILENIDELLLDDHVNFVFELLKH